jgi:hypothetical protein
MKDTIHQEAVGTARVGIAGTDTSGMRAMRGIALRARVRETNAVPVHKTAGFGVAGVKESTTARASFGVAGIDREEKYHAARAGVAGNLDHHNLESVLEASPRPTRRRLGDRAAAEGWRHGVYFSDFSYIVCTADRGRGETLRWRNRREAMFDKQHRRMPLWLDSAAYRVYTGTAPRWVSFDAYLRAIDLIQPEGFAAFDVIGDQATSKTNFDAMTAAGYGPDRGCFPVYHVRPGWDPYATITGSAWANIPQAARCAVANARIAAQDPIMRYYAGKSRLIGLGGMVRGPIPRDVRHYYIAELCRQMPEHRFWALGQANFKVINGLGAMDLLDRCWTDGTWWILDAACERFAVVMDGRIVMNSLEGIASSFFTIGECMAANLRSILAAYAGLITWPPPDPLPLDQGDPEQLYDLHARLHQATLDLFGGEQVRVCGNVPVTITE